MASQVTQVTCVSVAGPQRDLPLENSDSGENTSAGSAQKSGAWPNHATRPRGDAFDQGEGVMLYALEPREFLQFGRDAARARWSWRSCERSPVATDSVSVPRAPPESGSQIRVLGAPSHSGDWVVGDENGEGQT